MEENNINEKLTSAEMGKLWATYIGNSMSKCVISYYLKHVEDKDIKTLLENALKLTTDFMEKIRGIFEKENFPIPKGYGEADVNLDAPRLFLDEFYVHYLKYVLKAGLSIYSVAIPLVYRNDVKEFFSYCMDTSMDLLDQIKSILIKKGFIMKPPLIPVPEKVEFVQQDFLNGFFKNVRPLHALEIAHLYDDIESNITSKAVLMAFAQVVTDEKIRKLFEKGRDMTTADIKNYMQKLHDENLPSPSFLDDLVTTSTFSPFSNRLMLFHKIDMFSMKLRAIGNSVAVNGRHDLGFMYSKSLLKVSWFVEEAAKIYIGKGWMEKPPEAVERNKLVSE